MEGARIHLKGWQQAAVAIGSAFGALMDPRRADLIAALGETTGMPAFKRVLTRMKDHPEGREVLLERPRVISSRVSHAWDLPQGTFGAAYAKFMGSRNFSPDDRPPVRFVDTDELAYVAARAREVHDFWHVLFCLPTNLIGESSLKVIEFEQMLLPMCMLSVIGGTSRFKEKQSSSGITRSVTPNRGRYDSSRNHAPVGYVSADELVVDAGDSPGSAESITVTVRFRPLSEREFQRGDEIAWYADGEKMVRCEYNPTTAYAFGTVFAYGVTSSGKTHTMHGDQNSPGIIPLAIKDVFSIIQDTPGREFLLRVSYLEIYNEVINDLLDPTGQNLRVREDAQMIESSARGEEYDGVMYSQLVIGKLSESRATHIPYRDSKLTRLLQSSLSGHGLVSLICNVTPASSNMEETHNTLKFASRAKRVEIYASRNRIIDEKSLIKKYQREISNLKQELEQLKRGMLAGVSKEEITSLKQKLEEGQVKMQSRLEEEEEAKAALMSRIQRLTKLILVSTKNTIPGNLGDFPSHQNHHSSGEDEKFDIFGGTLQLLPDAEGTEKEPLSAVMSNSLDAFHGNNLRTLINLNEEQPSQLKQNSLNCRIGMTMLDQIDLLEEQVKMVAGEIALSSSTLKRMVEQSSDDPDNSQILGRIQNLELEIEEKGKHMRILEQKITKSRGSLNNQYILGRYAAEC
ncbi:hypothetical protein HPP92_014575 [Vanilla planifolia]|uniref:Ubiquinone biosynthesis protein COQ4 homolog, mitochondrial n=1 Tax=Vanilla planifolia TaxID=51239 RepID=A0A835QLP7_VANPL|nr:hypothetical protein HPP92_014575 [Vanilla planifolia]